ncbi:hypothetical protein EDB80DRAFT_700917 [Ilyonectria destructans]|nr:hypothetical protein EDB80DRAFT_700917 [Ilyonectria destructans]
MEDQEFHVLFVRHAEATSNVVALNNENGIDVRNMNEEAFRQSLLDIVKTGGVHTTVKMGEYLPDYLTKSGEESIERFVESAVYEPSNKVGVYRVFTSPLPRAAATAMRSIDKFELLDAHEGQPGIESHTLLQEATNWPQDMPTPSPRASYIQIKGGRGKDAGTVMGEGTLDMSAITFHGSKHDEETVETRLNTLKAPQSWEVSLEHAKRVREWLREHRTQIVRQHQQSGRGGIPKVVVFVHGGMFNLIVGRWYCSYKKNDLGDWDWVTSTVFRNLEVAAFRFTSDEKATLEEVPQSAEYEELFGDYYRHLGIVEYIDSNGKPVDQSLGHKAFVERIGDQVSKVLEQKPRVMKALANWTGVKDAVKILEAEQ